MADPGPPIKPPRGVKQQRETSGLLMSVIRTLSASESNEQRDREKAKLEKEYKRSDKKLDELVSVHDQDLTQVMQLFEKLSARVISSRDRIHAVKENLIACKMLLRCKREELKKLWLEGIEHKHVLYLLEEIDKLREVPSQLNGFLVKKHYLHGTRLLVTSLETSEGTLKEVEALREVRTELQTRKEKLLSKLLSELSQQLYSRPSKHALSLRRQGSGQARNSGRGSKRESAPSQPVKSKLHPDEVNANVSEDVNEEHPDQQPEHFMAILAESIALLGRLPDAVDTLKSSMEPEIMAVVTQTSSEVKLLYVSQSGSANLLELLQTVFDQFRAIAAAHLTCLQSFRRAAEKYRANIRLYEVAEVWTKMQAVLVQVLSNYLDVSNTAGAQLQAPPAYTESATTDLSAFFARRKPPKSKRTPLFKFDASSHSIGVSNHKQDQGEKSTSETDAALSGHALVCDSDPWNITTVFIPLTKFVEEIETATGKHAERNPCALRKFLSDFVQESFLGRQHERLASSVETATRAPDAWRATLTQDQAQELGISHPVLCSTYAINKCVAELRQLMDALPSYAEHFLAMACNMLRGYRETCQAAYRGIVQPDAEDKHGFSAGWLNDGDICRFLKSLPNWTNLQSHWRTGRQISIDEESAEDVWQRNNREAEILAGKLGERPISAHEILSDSSQLRGLAQLQESMEWFAGHLSSLTKSLPVMSSDKPTVTSKDQIPPLPSATVGALAQLANEFEDLANTCLLLLHLEVRVQCYHFLLPTGANGGGLTPNAEELEPRVLQLSRTITSVDEALGAALQHSKTKYIFEGLGHLIAKILITSAQQSNRIDEIGIQKTCRNILSLQQTLASVTMVREAGLDHARHYFELFYLTPEELLSSIMDKGSHFSELDYINALQLLFRSRGEPGPPSSMLQRLSGMLRDGVTV